MNIKQVDNLKTQSNRAANRAFSGFLFVEECLSKIHKNSTDGAFSRSMYILFSYHIELLIKSIILKYFSNQERPLSGIEIHNLSKLAKKVPAVELFGFGIKKIVEKKDNSFTYYEIYCTDKYERWVITVCDFVDVRYDYVRNSLREVDFEESNKMRKDVTILLKIAKELM